MFSKPFTALCHYKYTEVSTITKVNLIFKHFFQRFHSRYSCADQICLKHRNRNLTMVHLQFLNSLLQQFQEISQSFSGTAWQNTDWSHSAQVTEGSLNDANVFIRQEVTFVKDQETLQHMILLCFFWQHIVEVVIQETWHHLRLLRKLCRVDDHQCQICHFHPTDNRKKILFILKHLCLVTYGFCLGPDQYGNFIINMMPVLRS